MYLRACISAVFVYDTYNLYLHLKFNHHNVEYFCSTHIITYIITLWTEICC